METLSQSQRSDLERLLAPIGPSGFEEPATEQWQALARKFAAEVRQDAVGNSFATVNPGGSPRLAFVGHVDEIGLLVSKIDDDGFLRCLNIGGWDVGVLIGQRVRIRTSAGEVTGMVGRPAIHQLDTAARSKLPKLRDLWIDIGAESADEARELVSVGDPAVLVSSPAWVGEHRLTSRCLDDRLGSYTVLLAAEACAGLATEVVAIGSVGEEIGGSGARAAAYSCEPDYAVVVDVTVATDTPVRGDEVVKLGAGPVITRGATTNAAFVDRIIEIARDSEIPHQLRGRGRRTATDADSITPSGPGVVTALLSIPGRYLHSPNEHADMRDVAATVKLMQAIARELGQ